MNKELEASTDYLMPSAITSPGIFEEPSDQDQRRPVLPSGRSCPELVRHLIGRPNVRR